VKVLPCITAERSALLASCLSEARTQFVGKMVSKKNAVRCSEWWLSRSSSAAKQSGLCSRCDHMVSARQYT